MKSEGKTQGPSRSKSGERIAGLIVLAIGIPLVMSFTRAVADGERQRRETPLRAALGDESFERLERGEKTEVGYLGKDRLAPDFSLVDQTGKPWKLSAQRGKTVVMNFWSITCQPCVEEMPSLIELAEIAARRGDIELVTVSTDANWDAVKALFPPSSKLRVLFDPEKKIVRGKYGTRLYPETWIVDPKGVIRMRVDGAREWSSALMIDAITASQI